MIVKYMDALYPSGPLQLKYRGPAMEAAIYFRPKFISFMLNKDPEREQLLRDDLNLLFDRLEGFLQFAGTDFLLGEVPCCLDYELFPWLEQIRNGGAYWKDLGIPEDATAVRAYMARMTALPSWQYIRGPDSDTIISWERYSPLKGLYGH